MIPCVVFLNELSYRCDDTLTPAEIVPTLLSTLSAIRAAQKIRRDLVIAGTSPISKMAIGDGAHSIASLLTGDNFKDEWRFIRGLDQSSPGDASWNFHPPHLLEEVTFHGVSAFGLLWANRNLSVVLSLGFPPHWSRNQIAAQREEMNEDEGTISVTPIIIPNLSQPEHAHDHRELIANYGLHLSASSIVFEGNGFVARMYFNDHDPPHFHICLPGDPIRTVATCSIETLDTLEGHLAGTIQRRVRTWAAENKAQLIDNWTRCRSGLHPFRLGG